MKVSTLNEWLNESGNDGFLEPAEENLRKFNLDPGKVTINPDGSIDYDGDVDLSSRILNELPFKFNNVGGKFDCAWNKLTSLSGAPRSVAGSFRCRSNSLISLKGGPVSVGGNYNCAANQLVSLEGCPVSIGGQFKCNLNIILYNPTKYKGSFDLDKKWGMKDSFKNFNPISGKEYLKMSFKRLDELNYYEIIGIRAGLSKIVSLPEKLKEFCQGKIEEYLDKNSNNSFRKGYKELEDDVVDMF